ncbi:MAG TPA: hypothetical protein VFO10_18635 [Oligoflexus sp.]|uniref:HMA2 domain-containing protein n=1 Tax=Oligoflexus sp. TaxID=1971216 RepID=UPI002D7E4B2A|nr:hypothetical protein [Oligoflexus sp.]HET9239284.1 hypothetical protein [Oligoflexus sp.]
MTLSASVKHRAPGRMRLQLDEEDFNQVRLQDAVQALRRSSNLRRVQGNPVTRTILLEAETDAELDSALEEVSVAQVIELKPNLKGEEAPVSLHESWNRMMQKADRFLDEVSDGRMDMRSAVVVGLAILGVGQMTRGKFLPAGMTMLMYAAGLMDRSSEPKRKR